MRLCTLVTGGAIRDLAVLFETLRIFQKDLPHMYIMTDKVTQIAILKLKYPLEKLHISVALECYKGLGRKEMEVMPGTTFPTLWCDFMAEKCALLEFAAAADQEPVLFLDADICLLGPLPEPPVGRRLGLSPHMIRKHDTDKFGYYNGGFLWTAEPARTAAVWRSAIATSRFYEQAALEDVWASYPEEERFEFTKEHNFGWWRMFQSDRGFDAEQAQWSVSRAGILVNKVPLASIHTHWYETVDQATFFFNSVVLMYLKKMTSIPAVSKLVRFIEREFPHLG